MNHNTAIKILRALKMALEMIDDEAEKFQQETRRTSDLSSLLRGFVDEHQRRHTPGPWSRDCQLCKLVGEAKELLLRPINIEQEKDREHDPNQ